MITGAVRGECVGAGCIFLAAAEVFAILKIVSGAAEIDDLLEGDVSDNEEASFKNISTARELVVRVEGVFPTYTAAIDRLQQIAAAHHCSALFCMRPSS